jgi:hypothetical protein
MSVHQRVRNTFLINVILRNTKQPNKKKKTESKVAELI